MLRNFMSSIMRCRRGDICLVIGELLSRTAHAARQSYRRRDRKVMDTSQRLSAGEIENAVVDQLRGLLRSPEIIVRTWRATRKSISDIKEADVRQALERLDPLWDELFPAEQARVVHLLVERVDVSPDGVDIRLRTEGMADLVTDL